RNWVHDMVLYFSENMPVPKVDPGVLHLEHELRRELSEALEMRLSPILARLNALEAHLVQSTEEDGLLASSRGSGRNTVPTHSNFDEAARPQAKALDMESVLLPPVRQESAPSQDPCERVHVGETVWNFVLVIGLLDCGTMDTLIAFALMIGNAMMQALFCIAIMSPEFRGTAFASQLAVAKKWRLGVGHDSTYMDSTPTSLVARVCGSDETLIVANSQATLVRDITAYLGFDNADGSSWFSPGALLSTLCILHWCLYIFEEIRSICSTMHAISNVPRDQKSEMRGGRLIRISYFRFLSYFLLTVIRSCIAAVLLYAGVLWLAGTTSIASLMVNSVALAAIMDIDEKIFAALMPRQIQVEMDGLQPFTATYSRRSSQVESMLLSAVTAGLLAWSFVFLIHPLSHDMRDVKGEYCGGNQDFVLKSNADVQLSVAIGTVPYGEGRGDLTLNNLAVHEMLQEVHENSFLKYTVLAQTLRDFDRWSRGTISDWGIAILHGCTQWEDSSFLVAVAVSLGYEPKSGYACNDFASDCLRPEARLLRMLCPKTCGCNDPNLPWFRVSTLGCPQPCLDDAKKASAKVPCKDTAVDSAWHQAWSSWPQIWLTQFNGNPKTRAGQERLAVLSNISRRARENGCSALSNLGLPKGVPFNGDSVCQGWNMLISSLANLCPETCECTKPEYALDPQRGCPRSCESLPRKKVILEDRSSHPEAGVRNPIGSSGGDSETE
ncbi:unnamed protein product, partial [Symbiodinium sp. KB8]